MNNITRLHHALPLSPSIVKRSTKWTKACARQSIAPRLLGIPQGLIIALLHGQN